MTGPGLLQFLGFEWAPVLLFPTPPGLSCPSADTRALQGGQSRRFFLPMPSCSGSSHGKARPNLELRCISIQSEVICLVLHSNVLNELLAKDVLFHFLCQVPMPVFPFNVKWSAGSLDQQSESQPLRSCFCAPLGTCVTFQSSQSLPSVASEKYRCRQSHKIEMVVGQGTCKVLSVICKKMVFVSKKHDTNLT